jgi:hypothetical protein
MAIRMTEQLAEQLIEHYEHTIKMVRQIDLGFNIRSAIILCEINKIQYGLCFAADSLFKKNIYFCDWVRSFKNANYIATTPKTCNTIPEIITALQIRVDILKTFKNKNNG